jgi:hypothetical protein
MADLSKTCRSLASALASAASCSRLPSRFKRDSVEAVFTDTEKPATTSRPAADTTTRGHPSRPQRGECGEECSIVQESLKNQMTAPIGRS